MRQMWTSTVCWIYVTFFSGQEMISSSPARIWQPLNCRILSERWQIVSANGKTLGQDDLCLLKGSVVGVVHFQFCTYSLECVKSLRLRRWMVNDTWLCDSSIPARNRFQPFTLWRYISEAVSSLTSNNLQTDGDEIKVMLVNPERVSKSLPKHNQWL